MTSPTLANIPKEIQDRILTIIDQLVNELRTNGVEHRSSEEDLLESDLGISSLERVELLMRIEKAFNVDFDDNAMTEANTPRDLAAMVVSAGQTNVKPKTQIQETTIKTTTSPVSATTLIDALKLHADHTPDRVHIKLREDNGKTSLITYGALWNESVDIAAGLKKKGLITGETVAIMLRTERAFFSSFFGTLLAGGVPVPMYPPVRADRIEEHAQRQIGILQNSQARVMITFTEIKRLTELLVSQVPSLLGVVTPAQLSEENQNFSENSLSNNSDGGTPALIQYTSGSTGNPKGVLLTNQNLLANIRALQKGLDIQSDDIAVSWLPLYHDMGLIGAWLGTLYLGTPLILMSPLAFLAKPVRWLNALHENRATISAAPNFAYNLCTQRISDDDLAGLDLSTVRYLLNGAESVHPKSLQRFIDRFTPYGLRSEALSPVYGLAECSLGLAVTPPGSGAQIDTIDRVEFQRTGCANPTDLKNSKTLQIVSCGLALPDHKIRVVNKDRVPVPDRIQGRVQFCGPSATTGYYRNSEASKKLIGQDGWLETGDLGYLVNGEIFLTGRHKDLIISGGRNIHPHEAEETASSVTGVRKGCVAAFGVHQVDKGTEQFVIVAETKLKVSAEQQKVQSEITERVVSTLGVPPDLVVLAPPGAVRKTSSGKIRRGATRDAFLSGHISRGRSSTASQWGRLAVRHCISLSLKVIGALAKGGYSLYVLLLFLSTTPFLWALLSIGPKGSWGTRLIGKWTWQMFRFSGCRINVKGLKNIDTLKPSIFVANHASYLDPALMMSVLPVTPRFAAKARLAQYPILGTVLRRGNHITLDKSSVSKKIDGAAAVLEPLKNDESLFIFPEGTFVAKTGLLPFRLGAFRAATETGRPIVPIAISGTRRIFPAGTFLMRPGQINITIGSPLSPSGKDWQAILKLRDRAYTAIEREVDDPNY